MSRFSAVVVVTLILKCISKSFFSGKVNVGFADLTVYLDVCKASHSSPKSSPLKLALTTGEVTSKNSNKSGQMPALIFHAHIIVLVQKTE